ncbi:unnamed protein product [Anisakis simplex]|uniref:BHLH domain-containing protein n=1 Tax=Anisakis simplex TaxID=6269 RepID=A0A0M3J068_ANISI|nr:unnamed protein product [Anisakis simplex]
MKQVRQRARCRRTTVAQREAANERERRRMQRLNIAFNTLRLHIPTFVYEKSLSRIEVLRQEQNLSSELLS